MFHDLISLTPVYKKPKILIKNKTYTDEFYVEIFK